MTLPSPIAMRIGAAIAHAVEALGLGDFVRAAYADEYGSCRECGRPLGGASPERVCAECHADAVLAMAFGGGKDGEA